ncbi:ABC transporter permease subunit [Lentisphaera profundi]|uniref:ABC transporter permease subunit n=1 Tax=Lentisphaera profundi TaxID=1658616 RepID=A0ABY7VV09_9BACT|nr:ABC transporter permease subunit [Lentisphaera profundi]WDE97124.1 ABC transporter permease subunit [Lentisphaera profundi]
MSDLMRTSKKTLIVDKFMTGAIKICGIGIIAAVMCLLLYIVYEVCPLSKKAEVEKVNSIQLGSKDMLAFALDEWSTTPTTIDSKEILFHDLNSGSIIKRIELKTFLNLNLDEAISASTYNQAKQQFIAGTNQGRFFIIDLNYSREEKDNQWVTIQDPSIAGPFEFSKKGEISQISYGAQDEQKLCAAVINDGESNEIHIAYLSQSMDLFGNAGDLEIEGDFQLKYTGTLKNLLVSNQADQITTTNTNGELTIFKCTGSEPELLQNKSLGQIENALIAPILGDQSLVTIDQNGKMIGLSYYKENPKTPLLFHETKHEFEALPRASEYKYSGSGRNKSFLVSSDKLIRMYNFTTEQKRWEYTADSVIKAITISAKYDNIFLLDGNAQLHQFSLNDPHPESSWKTFFGKIHYEGAPEASYKWESTGGTDEAEMKLSMLPLIYGTLKATFYAMLFAMPIALLAALYTSQFLHPDIKKIVKPLMEIMASLPSVIIGFFGAIWLAPRLENTFPSLIMVFVTVPAITIIFAYIQSKIKIGSFSKSKDGHEFIWLIPVLIISAIIGWKMGPIFENIVFGGSFKAWWNNEAHLNYESKNAVVVGFSMGFAVIPIIFTIAEDALSNVPKNLTSASLALGASRWQTAIKVVLPTASAGIFSACMIGLGRAVGETMIVLFCCGGTPIMESNPFSGMRTLAVNLATELPEAPKDGTLFRTLFLGALLLFLMTFVINTIAEIMRQHLRNKYKV